MSSKNNRNNNLETETAACFIYIFILDNVDQLKMESSHNLLCLCNWCIVHIIFAFYLLLLLRTVKYPWPKRMGVALQCWWADELLIGLLDDRK